MFSLGIRLLCGCLWATWVLHLSWVGAMQNFDVSGVPILDLGFGSSFDFVGVVVVDCGFRALLLDFGFRGVLCVLWGCV